MHRTLLALALLSACSDDSAAPIDAAPPVDAPLIDVLNTVGTGTLLVTGTFVAENVSNGTDGTYVRVNCDLRVSKDGAPVTAAIINVNPAPPAYQQTLVGDALDPSHYTGNYIAYGRTAHITVTYYDNPDFVGDVLLEGPQLFQIEQPASGDVTAGAPLHVTWSQGTSGAADSADVESATGYAAIGLADTGSHDIPGEYITGSLDAGTNEITVTKWNDNPLTPGAAAGSVIHFGVRSHKAINPI
jgi:hypothetical protein